MKLIYWLLEKLGYATKRQRTKFAIDSAIKLEEFQKKELEWADGKRRRLK